MRKRESKRVEMFELIETYQRSEETQMEFCKRVGMKIHCFRYWLNQYRENSRIAEDSSGFVRITTEAAMYPREIELRFPNGVRVGLGDQASADFLVKLIRLW